MRRTDIPEAIRILREEYVRFKTPYVTQVANHARKDPFKVLISCIISLRTKDETTREASERLFKKASTPQGVSRLTPVEIEKLIYPAGFYRVKARVIAGLSTELMENHNSEVPDTIEGLLKLKGVGRKTANLVVTMGFGKPGICVDTHVHRIANRWGFVSTKTPEETEFALRKRLDKKYWMEINDLLVAFGQNVCRPVSPVCTGCRISAFCKRIGVLKSR